MKLSCCVVVGCLVIAAVGSVGRPAHGSPIGMPAGSTVWMKFEASVCPDAAFDDCVGSNQAGPSPPNGIPLVTFGSGDNTATGFAEVLPGGMRTFIRGSTSVFMHASFEDVYTVGGSAVGPFDIPVELHVSGVARSVGLACPSPICHQLVVANGEAEIGTFNPFTDGLLGEGLRVTPFDAASLASFLFPTQASGSPFEVPIDVTARYTVQDVMVGDTFTLAFGMNARTSRGEIDLLNTGLLSFDLPDGVFLTSALAESVPEPGGLVLLATALGLVAGRRRRRP